MRFAVRSLTAGFTLIELIMVLVVIATLSAVALPRFVNLGTDSRISATQNELVTIRASIAGSSSGGTGARQAGYIDDLGSAPAALQDLSVQPGGVLSYDPHLKTGWNGPYIGGDFTNDAWGRPYVYVRNPDGRTGQIRSLGPNGVDNGGAGDDIVEVF